MDRSWMRANRLSDEFDHGVAEFLELAEKNLPNNKGLFPCPCVSYGTRDPKLNKDEIRDHISWKGICQNYTRWICLNLEHAPAVEKNLYGFVPSVFNDPTPFIDEELYDLRNNWATCFLDLVSVLLRRRLGGDWAVFEGSPSR
ncbi:hypothetical protein OROGR_022878 [Orobanche gracilis]